MLQADEGGGGGSLIVPALVVLLAVVMAALVALGKWGRIDNQEDDDGRGDAVSSHGEDS